MKLRKNRCRQCNKLFCCVNCRLAHENKKHSDRELKCPLCCSKELQIKGDEGHEFICHLVFHHLPLLCRLCGQNFKSNQDLELLQRCAWWKTENSQRLLQVLGKTFTPTPLSDIKTSLNFYNNKESVTESRHSSDFVTFNSPPVLTRNTSTPMHIGLNAKKANLEFKSLNTLSFLLKTPRNFSPSLEDKASWPIIDSGEIKRCNSDTQYYSGFHSSRSSLQGSSLAQKSTNSSTNTTAYYSCDQLDIDSGRRSNIGTTIEEISEVEVPSKKEVKEFTKRVRFSDQYEQLSQMAENDEFFEARENLSVPSKKNNSIAEGLQALTNLTQGSSDISANQENQMNVDKENRVGFEENNNFALENKVPPRENEVCLKENKISPKEDKVSSADTRFCPQEDKNNSLPNIQTGSLNPGSSGNNPMTIEQSGSSRVVMMVLVENTSEFSRSKLAPLIDSGLKKLEETAASLGNVHSSVSGRSSQVERKVSDGTRESGTRRRSVTSVNSYLSVTSTECFSAQSGSLWHSSNEKSSSGSVESSKSDGILSVVARVVRSALRKLPGASSEEDSRESIMQHSRSTTASRPELPTSRYDSNAFLHPTANQPLGKRPRDPTSPPAISGSSFQTEERSPIAKRPRGWYKIRGREPIARMRKVQITSPKGISSETQRFQMGSLSVGRENTILPLPSRAHQCTQTE